MARAPKNKAAEAAESTVGELYTPDQITSGLALGLGESAFWSLTSSKIILNSFNGKVSARVPEGLTQDEQATVALSLNLRQIVVVDEVKDAEPAVREIESMLSSHSITARRMTDETDLNRFRDMVFKTNNVRVLDACLAAEKEGRNRGDYVKIVNTRLSELRG